MWTPVQTIRRSQIQGRGRSQDIDNSSEQDGSLRRLENGRPLWSRDGAPTLASTLSSAPGHVAAAGKVDDIISASPDFPSSAVCLAAEDLLFLRDCSTEFPRGRV